ncbi:MAG: type II toxin-antitoxin system VapC family toxin [Oscillospiraceae bacterium]|jgi:PIN domain nuclease of toxin-antitoxin system|nr:type II toxin-antitoxin system VapC family toxin [Oscillospiraceae bacterium]
MKYLLDTHVVIWVAANPLELPDNVKSMILDPDLEKYVSIVSAWETAIKLNNGKLNIKGGLLEFYRMVDENGFIQLGVEREYIDNLARLPMIHRDPFDRMLIATALVENLTLITIDENIRKYDVATVW